MASVSFFIAVDAEDVHLGVVLIANDWFIAFLEFRCLADQAAHPADTFIVISELKFLRALKHEVQ